MNRTEFGGQRVAVRNTAGLNWLHSDHLGSASVTTNASGNKVAELRYKPFGEVRFSSGTLPTNRKFNGNIDDGFGTLDYGARMLSPLLGRFLSADTIVPRPNDPQSLNRFAYVRNNPVNRIDPTGHADTCGFRDECGGGMDKTRYYIAKAKKAAAKFIEETSRELGKATPNFQIAIGPTQTEIESCGYQSCIGTQSEVFVKLGNSKSKITINLEWNPDSGITFTGLQSSIDGCSDCSYEQSTGKAKGFQLPIKDHFPHKPLGNYVEEGVLYGVAGTGKFKDKSAPFVGAQYEYMAKSMTVDTAGGIGVVTKEYFYTKPSRKNNYSVENGVEKNTLFPASPVNPISTPLPVPWLN